MIRAVFFDIDGTLVSLRTHRISESTHYALKELKKKGIKIFIATGRHQLQLNNLEDIEFDGYVTLNGQYCYDNNKIIHTHPIHKDDIRAIVSQLEVPLYTCMFTEENDIYINAVTPAIETVQKSISFPMPPVKDISKAMTNNIYQLMIFVPETEVSLPLSALPHCKSTRWHPLFIDATPIDGGKEKGIGKMIDFYNIKPEETMVFGDAHNDISMLTYAGTGIAMGNAADEVKAAADYITEDADNDGIYHALKRFDII